MVAEIVHGLREHDKIDDDVGVTEDVNAGKPDNNDVGMDDDGERLSFGRRIGVFS